MLRLILGFWILSALLRGPRRHYWGGPYMGCRRPPMGYWHRGPFWW